ncbi:MAG TPA: biosynthetic-type acetolactate synthase large subunit, partial [Opitutaceae bacterium]|nr:biosynthetic-type acetolactate synthase large subunit [Opitutaceae bacterium]
MKTSTSPTTFPQAEIGHEMKGAECVVECLIREGVDVIFAYPGGASQELHQALARTDKIRTILPRHEQGGSFAAEGYARATGKVGVCMATSGPGATNLVSAIADAFMDSTPLVAITGQVYSKYIGKMAFQETDFYGMTLPIVKHSYLVMNAQDLPRIFKEAFHIARSGRPGPVVIDIPKDVQQAKITPVYPATVEFRNPYIGAVHRATDEQLKQILPLIAGAKKPVLYVGGGIISADGHAELKTFAEKTNIPVATTLMGVGAFPESHPLSMQWFGMHGAAYGNWAVDQCDLLIVLGARFDDRITGEVSKFAANAKIVHIDIDASEHNKNKRGVLPIVSDIKYALGRLNELIAAHKFTPPDTAAWQAQIAQWKKEQPFDSSAGFGKSPHILPQEAVAALYELTKGDAIITTGVGQHQMWAAQFYRFNEPRRYISSLGLGAMGFGYPAALGAKVAHPDKQVIDIDASEHNKNKHVLLPVLSDIKYALGRLNELIAVHKFTPPDTTAWHAQIAQWKKEQPFDSSAGFGKSPHILPQEAVAALYELTKGDAIITTGVGQHQMWAAQFYRFNEPRRYISSLGLGAMGFGYPAALGAKVAFPEKQVIDIDGDGSFAMNIQELATAHIEKIAAKAMILNNQHLGMVVQWEDRFYGSVRGNTILGDESNVGSPDNPSALYPDFVKIAEGYGVKGR